MRKIGLKLWSINTDHYLEAARKLYDAGVYDYIELYVVPGSMETLEAWARLPIPFIIHNAHFMHGFNLAKAESRQGNLRIYRQTAKFADALKAEKIIFHGGIDGEAEETARQLKGLGEERALLENKPFVAIPNKMGGNYCRGATESEIKYILSEAGCGFCLDIGHAVCSAVSQGLEPYSYVQSLNSIGPAMYHLSDIADMGSPYDAHPHLGTGELDLKRILTEIMDEDAPVSLETEKNSRENLDDFERDAAIFKRCAKEAGKGLCQQ